MWNIASAKITGVSHERNNLPCQDAIYSLKEKNFICGALADGAGSAKHSDEGANLVVSKICSILKKHFDTFYHLEVIDISKKIVHILRTNIGIYSKNSGIPKTELETTLLFVAIKDNCFIAGHIGDGVIGVLKNDKINVLSFPENGEFINETFFVSSTNYSTHFRIYKGEIDAVNGFVLMSDGTSESLYNYSNKELASVNIEIINWLNENSENDVSNALYQNLKSIITKKTTDDCSILIMNKKMRTQHHT